MFVIWLGHVPTKLEMLPPSRPSPPEAHKLSFDKIRKKLTAKMKWFNKAPPAERGRKRPLEVAVAVAQQSRVKKRASDLRSYAATQARGA